MQASNPTFYGTVTLNGSIVCAPTTGRKIDIYSDGATIYGMGLNDFEYCIFGGAGSAFSYRIAREGATDLAGDIALFVNAAGIGLPVGAVISWGTNTLRVDPTGALLVNGAPLAGGGGATGTASITGGTINGATIGGTTPAPVTATALAATTQATVGTNTLAQTAALYFNAAAGQVRQFVYQTAGSIRWTIGANNAAETGANAGSDFAFARWSDAGAFIANAIAIARATGAVAIPNLAATGGSIDGTTVGATTPAAGTFTGLSAVTLALSGSQTAKFVLAAPNAVNGAPGWRQLVASDVTNLAPGLATLAWGGGAVVANGTYVLAASTPYPLTINSLDHEVGTAAGSFTVSIQTGTPGGTMTAVTGLNAVAVSTAARTTTNATAANAVAAGNRILAVVSGVTGSPTGAVLGLKFTRT